jgi:hypothetical protein
MTREGSKGDLAIGLASVCVVLAASLLGVHAQSASGFFCNNVTTNCSDHAVNVSGGFVSGGTEFCNCTCRNNWTGTRCNICPIGFNPSLDCGNCSTGYIGYPNCTDDRCTQADCSFHASTVSGTRSTGCTCVCLNSYTGGNCSSCPVNFDPSKSCGACNRGYDTLPNCYKSCTRAGNCSNHGAAIGNEHTGCNCSCDGGWIGDTCNVCGPNWDGTRNCASCLPGYSRDGKLCRLLCTVDDNCTDGFSRADNVVGWADESCLCSCINHWQGNSCAACPFNYAGPSCDECADGYNEPDCVPCSVEVNCSSRASSAVYNATNDTCTCVNCRNHWYGAHCELCPINYDPSPSGDCGRCNTQLGFSGDNCDRTCTDAEDCSGNARVVNGTFTSGCQCTCDFQWEGGQCELCPDKYDSRFVVDCSCCTCAADRDKNTYPICELLPTTTTVAPTTTTGIPTTTGGQPTTVDPSSTTVVPPSTTPIATPNSSNPQTTTPPTAAPTSSQEKKPTKSQEREKTETEPVEPSKTPPPTATLTLSTSDSVNATRSASFSDNVSITQSVSMTLSDTICPQNLFECLMYNHTANGPPVNCNCPCVNMWSTATCSYCESRYDGPRGDCGNCSNGYYFYPTCDYGLFLHGNYTPYWADRSVIQALLKADLMFTLADDLTDFVRNLTCNNASNVTAFILKYDEARGWFNFDIDVLSADPADVVSAVDCISDALDHWYVVPMNHTRRLTEKLYPNRNVTVLLQNASYNVSDVSPCGDWCQTGNAPVDIVPPEEEEKFPIGIVIGIIVALLLLLLLSALLYKRYRDVQRMKMNRIALKERMLGESEMSHLQTEMLYQDVLPGGKVASDSYRAGSTVYRRANAPVVIPQHDI